MAFFRCSSGSGGGGYTTIEHLFTSGQSINQTITCDKTEKLIITGNLQYGTSGNYKVVKNSTTLVNTTENGYKLDLEIDCVSGDVIKLSGDSRGYMHVYAIY